MFILLPFLKMYNDMSTSSNKNTLFPIFVKLSEIQSLIVGGGNVALEKLHAIVANSPQANIEVVAPDIRPEIITLVQSHPHCKIIQKI